MQIPSFDQWFMTEAYLKAMKSKDQSTKVGAVIVGPDNEPISSGYNSLPRGAQDNIDARQNRPLKYEYFEHAERNAIYNAARHGVALKGTRIFVTMFPCMDCARGIINSGITEVVYHKANPRNINRDENQLRSHNLLEECGVFVREWDGEILKIQSWVDGKSNEI